MSVYILVYKINILLIIKLTIVLYIMFKIISMGYIIIVVGR